MITDEAIYAELQSSDINSKWPPRLVFLLTRRRITLPPQPCHHLSLERPSQWNSWNTVWSKCYRTCCSHFNNSSICPFS